MPVKIGVNVAAGFFVASIIVAKEFIRSIAAVTMATRITFRAVAVITFL
jgi:hypothetical protein